MGAITLRGGWCRTPRKLIVNDPGDHRGLLRAAWQRLAPLLWEFRLRVALALAAMLLGKGALLLIPFFLLF